MINAVQMILAFAFSTCAIIFTYGIVSRMCDEGVSLKEIFKGK